MYLFLHLIVMASFLKNFPVGGNIQVGNLEQKEARFDRFDGTCGGRKDVLIVFVLKNMKVVLDKLMLNGSFIVKQNIMYPTAMDINIKRCRSKENLNSCEDFHSFSTNKYCQFLQTGSQTWSPFFKNIKPEWKCPLKQGTYVAEGSELEISPFLLFPVDGWFWKVRGAMRDGRTNKLIMCIYVEAKVDFKKKSG